MGKTETLTAYKCKFDYLRRNNPLIEEQREAIKTGQLPRYTLSDFINDYVASASRLAVGENSDRAIQFSSTDWRQENIRDGAIRWALTPRSGKQGKPVTVMKTSTLKQYNYGPDTAALYDHYVFLYEHNGSIIAIFHRQNGSGCKSVFLETANKMLKEKGLKLSMELCMPLSEVNSQAIPTQITLQCVRQVTSSDIADYSERRKKPIVVKTLGLNLSVQDNSKVRDKVSNFVNAIKLGKIDADVAFARLKAELSDSDEYNEYNDAEIQVNIGRRRKTVPWKDVENILGGYDISEKLYSEYRQTGDFIGTLTKLADNYYYMMLSDEGEC